ncbi:MAG: hypothetical protein OSA98_05605 [Rubripirellula sp.]|nr:hypothetical protein [Rubripirellula sp.]
MSIPLIAHGLSLPAFVLIFPSMILLVALVAAIVAGRSYQFAWAVIATSLFACFLLDQHRLQPWAYQSCIYALIFATMSPATGRKLLIPLAASVYVYSAVGKFDYQFTHTVGQDLLAAVARLIGGLPENLDATTRARLALLFPAAEFVAGLGLLASRTRRPSAVVLMLMHLSLLAILGPWGLNHSRGVLLWNMMLIAQAYLLMWREPNQQGPSADKSTIDKPTMSSEKACSVNKSDAGESIASWLVRIIVVLVILSPVLERSGCWDHWTSWSLYSPHTSRAEIELHRSVIGKIDPHLAEFLEEDKDGDGWQRLSLESWSLTDRFVPIYPQSRYQLSLANQLCSSNNFDAEIRVKLRGVADRWTGERSESRLIGQRQISQACNDFWLNNLITQP